MTPQVCRHLIDDPNLKPNTQFIPKPYQLIPHQNSYSNTQFTLNMVDLMSQLQ